MGRKFITNDTIKELISSKGGILHSITGVGSKAKLSITCDKGHTWNTGSYTEIKSHNAWCPYCSNNLIKPDLITDIHNISIKYGGKCLSDKIISYKDVLNFVCNKGHKFSTNYNNIKYGSWCSKCRRQKISDPLPDINDIANARGGQLLSTEFSKSTDYLQFQCSQGHLFSQTRKRLLLGSWCSECGIGISEKITKLWFEEIFKVNFKKAHCSELFFLKLSNRVNLELDGFNNDLKIAFEYNGQQHYNDVINSKTKEIMFEKSKYDDVKIKLCADNNIKLFVIPYTALKDIKNNIKLQALKLNVALPNDFDSLEININDAYKINSNFRIVQLDDILKLKNYKLLSNKWISCTSRYNYICNTCNKEYSGTPVLIKCKKQCC